MNEEYETSPSNPLLGAELGLMCLLMPLTS